MKKGKREKVRQAIFDWLLNHTTEEFQKFYEDAETNGEVYLYGLALAIKRTYDAEKTIKDWKDLTLSGLFFNIYIEFLINYLDFSKDSIDLKLERVVKNNEQVRNV